MSRKVCHSTARTVSSLRLIATVLPANFLALSPIPMASAQTSTQNRPLLTTVGRGEIRLDGVVRAFDPTTNRILLEVASFTLPNGKTQRLPKGKSKTVLLQETTSLWREGRQGEMPRAALTSSLRVGTTVAIIGQDLGSGQGLPARVVLLDVVSSISNRNAPSVPDTTSERWQPPETVQPIFGPVNMQTAITRLPLRLPAPPTARRTASIPGSTSAEAYRRIALTAVAARRFEQAVAAYRAEARVYRRMGLVQAALVEENKAARYETRVGLFVDRPLTLREIHAVDTNAPLEPRVGCYIGAYVENDDLVRGMSVPRVRGLSEWTANTFFNFAALTGKAHGSYFRYLHYGSPFPSAWVAACKMAKVIPQLSWEPNDLNQVQNDEYLNTFARACRDAQWPVFVRFASEMNGFWTPYHDNPALYRQKFRLMHQVLHRYTAQVATIWCVNNPPLGNIQDYYPGDDGCDWVGVNFYSVPFYNNDPKRPAELDSPLALLDPIYQKYASKKPIAICEYAASHKSRLDMKSRPGFAISKLSLLYGALPRLYPRVKLIDWFDMNTLSYPVPGKTLSNYALSENQSVRDVYCRTVSEPYFLGQRQYSSDSQPLQPRPLLNGQVLRSLTTFSVFVKTYVSRPQVYLQIGNQIVYAAQAPGGAQRILLDVRRFPSGNQTIKAYVYDDRNVFITEIGANISIQR